MLAVPHRVPGTQCFETAARVVLTLLDLSPLPLSNARPAGVCKDCAANLGEGVQHAITLNSGPAFTHYAQYPARLAQLQSQLFEL